MRSEVINEHKIKLLSASPAGFAAFAAQYAAYDSFETIHEVLLYSTKPIDWNAESFDIIAKSVSIRGGLSALTLLLSAYCGLDKTGKEAEFDAFPRRQSRSLKTRLTAHMPSRLSALIPLC